MAFALRRAVLNPEIRRVIVVIPYLSIIEQNARVYRNSLGSDAVLEHHSGAMGADEDDESYLSPEQRRATENWDAPVVVTTSVRFFETLFSNHPRELRRLHNIARSVVILDEVQTLPRQYVQATLSMLKELAERWGVTFVFSTATQPALESAERGDKDPRWPAGTLTEIVLEPARLFESLRRVETEWRRAPVKWAEAAGELATLDRVLVIVNTRGQALALFRELRRRDVAAIHLSNNLCPAHRLKRLDEIRGKLGRGEPCRVIATQLVEAGVDLDFPVVWRALGPLDSIAQAAGRCDREGLLTDARGRPGGRLVVFETEDGKMPPGAYKEGAGHARAMAEGGTLRWDDPEVIRQYFNRLYQGDLDPKGIQEDRQKQRFKTVAEKVSWIEENTRGVMVPYDDEAVRLIQEIQFAGVSLDRFRRAQKYTVNLWESEFWRGLGLGSVYEVQPKVWACPEGFYDEELGIRLEGADEKELTV